MQQNQILEKVICISLEGIRLWGARKKLQVADLDGVAEQSLPPADLASLGSKRIFDAKSLNRFEALKKQAHNACAKRGIRFLGGYAVPAEEAAALGTELDAIGVLFEDAKRDLLATYDDKLDDWVARYPGWESWIRREAKPKDAIADRISYGWTPARISTPSDEPDSILNKKMAEETGGLAGRLFCEIADAAEDVLDAISGKPKVNRRALSPIRNIRSKMSGLAFLDSRVKPLLKLIDDTLAQMPGDAPIEGVSLTALTGLVMILSEPSRMRRYGESVLNGSSQSDALDDAGEDVTEVTTVSVKETEEPTVATAGSLIDDLFGGDFVSPKKEPAGIPAGFEIAPPALEDQGVEESIFEVKAVEVQTPMVEVSQVKESKPVVEQTTAGDSLIPTLPTMPKALRKIRPLGLAA
ncbi:DUF3150 domain-containing protein [Azonexus hydrophilus]|uniref:DUF3150 domain-containing protein n=1 Tax=Azonexus hydrophilus TaxID=418702 RepID=A0ABZ2XNP7_9RHOO